MSDDIRQYKQILQEAIVANSFDPDKIANYITITGPGYSGVRVLFKIPINDTFEIEDDYDDEETVTVSVTSIDMIVDLLPDDDVDDRAPDGFMLKYQYNLDNDDDDRSVKGWFGDGEYDYKVQSYLLKAGFSNAASSDIEVEGMLDDVIEYSAGDVAREMTTAALLYLKSTMAQGAGAMISKFGPIILTADLEFTASDVAPHKTAIIKFLLNDIKAKGHNSKALTVVMSKLRNVGVAWPELDTIEQSMNAGKLTETLKLSDLNTASEKRQLTAVKKDGSRIQYIENPSPAVQLAAVQQNGGAILWIKNPSPAVQLAAVQQNAWLIRYIKNPSPALQMAAVQQTSLAICQIENPSPAVQMAAVQQDGRAIESIINPSPELFADKKAKHSIIKHILYSIKNNRLVAAGTVEYLRKHNANWPELDVIEQSMNAGKLTENDNDADINTASEAEQIAAVKNKPYSIDRIDNPSLAVQLAAVQRRPWSIQYIKNPSLATQMAVALGKDPLAIMTVAHPTPELFADNKTKHSIIKTILRKLKEPSNDDNENINVALDLLVYLRNHNVNWPELDTIEQSIGSGS